MSTEQPSDVVRSRWLILFAMMSVTIMGPLDGSAVNIAIPVIQQEFHVAFGQVAWVTLAYLLVLGGFILPVGRLGDLWGFRRIFLSGVVLFTLSSALCGFASGFWWLVAARAAQGVGACLMMALSSGIATALFPARERGRALGVVGMGVAVGLILGPVLGGLIIDSLGWRGIFFINVPIGLLGGLFCWRMLPAFPPQTRARVDWLGGLLAVLALGSLLLAITRGADWGWGSSLVLLHFAAALIFAILFFTLERRIPHPMLHLPLFTNRVFAGANFASMMSYLGQFCVLFLTPTLLMSGLGFHPGQVGRTMAVIPLAALVLAPLSGALSDRLGTRLPAVVGASLIGCGLLGLSYAAAHGSLHGLIASLALSGVGSGIFQSPNNSAVMGSVPREHLGIGSGVLATMRNLGMAFGIAVSSTVATLGTRHYLALHPHMDRPALLHGMALGYLAGALFIFLGAITSAVRDDQEQAV